MRVGFGFSNVTFRPSRIFHSRVFSYPSVDTDEQSIGCLLYTSDAAVFHLRIKDYKNTPASFLLLFVNVQALL